jgi:hypothetical protein
MNQAHYPILRITVPSGKYKFHDEGYVSSINETAKRLDNSYGCNDTEYNARMNVIGAHYVMGTNSHIFYMDQGSIVKNLRVRAHEETHSVDFIGQLDFLTDRLLEEQNVKINLKEIDNIEVRAELGSLYALYSRGFGPWSLVLDSLFKTDFIVARKIYTQSRQPQKSFFLV